MKLYQRIKESARGKWREIHKRLGIEARYLNPRKHSPCPACGGRDRYRYTDWQGEGGFICNQCGSGNGFELLMRVYGYSFREALQAVANLLGEKYSLSSFKQRVSLEALASMRKQGEQADISKLLKHRKPSELHEVKDNLIQKKSKHRKTI